MSGLLRRLTRRRPATADETGSPAPESFEPAAAPAETPAEPGGDRPVPASGEGAVASHATEGPATEDGLPPAPWPGADDQPTEVITATREHPAPGEAQAPVAEVQPPPARDLPAGVDRGELEVAPAASARRSRLRRRLRYLRRVRELLLRDLGGFTYEVHRTAGGTHAETHRRLADIKAARLSTLDAEVHELEARLGEPHAEPVLREPGVGGTCPECGELFSSDAHYCYRCGTPLDARARAEREATIAAAAQPDPGSQPAADLQPASVLWAAGPRPRAQAGAEEEKPASMATSEWLARRAGPPAEEQPQTIFARPPAAEPRPEATPGAGDDEPASAGEEPAPIESPPAAGDGELATAAHETPAAGDDGPAKAAHETPAAGDDEPARAVNETPAGGEDEPAKADELAPFESRPAPAAGADELSAAGDDEPETAVDEPAAGDDEPATAAHETPAAGDDEPATAAHETPAAGADEPETAVDEPAAAPGGTSAAGADEAAAIPAEDPRAASEAADERPDTPNGRVTPLGSREPRP